MYGDALPATRAPKASKVARRWRGPLSDLPVVVIDLETTGLNPREDRVVEIAMLSSDGMLDTLVRPEPARTFEGPHDLSLRAVKAAPAFCDIVDPVRRSLAGRLIVGHNVAFDIAFLEAEFRRWGHPLGPLPFICTVALADMLGLDHERRRLSYACERYGVALLRPHVALHDAHAARELFCLYCQIAAEQGVDLELLGRANQGDACARSWAREGMGCQPASRPGRVLLPRAAA
jgi:DNA polymerase III epsilon subunit-like protein